MGQSAHKSKNSASGDRERQLNRPWLRSASWAAVTMAILLGVAVGVNALIGRVIHWEIVTGLGILGFVFLSIGRRYRTV